MSTQRQEALTIVGAGPAGLMAAVSARVLHPLVLEAGRDLANRDERLRSDLAGGVGGAGLYSDGKFSFRPSATNLWSLNPRLLEEAEASVGRLLAEGGLALPATSLETQATRRNNHSEKQYPSVYMSFDHRLRMIRRMATSAGRVITQARVERIRASLDGWELAVSGETIRSQGVILASGRFGPLLLQDSELKRSLKPRRLEVGLRIQQPTDQFFLRSHPQLDPKLLWRDDLGKNEWRTFCCCRDGLIETTESEGLLTVSGRGDCPPTGSSNVGFNLRITDPEEVGRLWPDLRAKLRLGQEPTSVPLARFLAESPPTNPYTRFLGEEVVARLIAGVRMLVADFGTEQLRLAQVVGPAVEGVGQYPVHDSTLEAHGRLWVAGDISGDFRGLTAALVSGFLAGRAACEKLGVATE